jgi:hypothetical protein
LKVSQSNWFSRNVWIVSIIVAVLFVVYSLTLHPEESIKFFSLSAYFVAISASKTDQGWLLRLRIPVMIIFTFIGTVIFAGAAGFKLLQSFEFYALLVIKEKIESSRSDAS